MRPSARRDRHRSAWLAALALAIALGASAGSSEAQAKSPAASSPASAQEGKDSNLLLGWLQGLGVPAGALAAGGILWTLFLQGETIQKNGKAWLTGWRRKADPPAPSPPTPSGGPAASGNANPSLQQVSAGGDVTVATGGAVVHNESSGRDLVQGDQVQGDQFNAPATVTKAQTVNQYFAAGEPKRERIFSTIAPPPQGVGVMGREQELDELDARMGEPGNNRRLVVHGESGVGKSELLREYGRRHEARYPAGRYWIDCRCNLAQEIASLGRQCWQMTWLEGPLEEQAMAVLQQLAKQKVLLLLDNATNEEQVEPFLPPAGQAHVLLSSTSREWGPPLVEVWRPEGVQRLDPSSALKLIEKIAGAEIAHQLGKKVLQDIGGLPVHLLPAARTLARQARTGRLSEEQLVHLSQEASDSFSLAWNALTPGGRILLQACSRWFNSSALVESELVATLAEGFQGEAAVLDVVDACRDLYLLQGEKRLWMHQLLVNFVENQPAERVQDCLVVDLGPAIAAALSRAAERVEQSPADDEALAALYCHKLSWDFWGRHHGLHSPISSHNIGKALFQMGEFSEAIRWFLNATMLLCRQEVQDYQALGDNYHEIGNCDCELGQWHKASVWFKRAVVEMRKGDLAGRVDHSSIGASLHHLGYCASQRGEWQDAATWLVEALEEMSQGDPSGQVYHDNVASSLHVLGNCAYEQGKWQEAADWYRKAVEFNESIKENKAEKFDHESLGLSLHRLGDCAMQMEQWQEATEWYYKSAEEIRQGNQHGQVDHDSLGRAIHQLGYCASMQGHCRKAADFYEKALAQTREGDLFGRVDHLQLGLSLHQLGYCASEQRQWHKAETYYKDAVLELRQGDLHRQMDHHHLGRYLHQLGYCAYRKRQWAQAANWFEQALGEIRQGDRFGRVDLELVALMEERLALCRKKMRLT